MCAPLYTKLLKITLLLVVLENNGVATGCFSEYLANNNDSYQINKVLKLTFSIIKSNILKRNR